MIKFEGSYFFMVPQSITSCDTDFSVYDCNGNCVGTCLSGVRKLNMPDEKREQLEELLQERSIEIEVKIRFLKKFNIETHHWKETGLSKAVIIEQMSRQWKLVPQILERYLLD